MITATTHASAASRQGFTNSPILNRSEVKRTSGITAKGSCRLRTTWLRMRSSRPPFSIEHRDHRRRDDRERTRNEPTQPARKRDIEESLHHDLARKRAGNGRVLP